MVYALHQLVSRVAASDPTHEAVRWRDSSITYHQLEVASNGIARALIEGGVQRGDRVALYMPKSIEAVVALYGIMKAGAAYVPIDPIAPAVRAAMIAADCSVRALITSPTQLRALTSELGVRRPSLAIIVEKGEEATGGVDIPTIRYEEATSDRGASPPDVPLIDTDLAYILYTSGSTGVPKGVMLTHRHALTFVEWCAAKLRTTSLDRFSNHAPLHFDLSVFDLFVAAHSGATVAIVPEEQAYFGADLVRFIGREGITVWYSVPSALTLIAKAQRSPDELASLRTVVFAGEVYPTGQLRVLRELVPEATLWNLYGPTETNVCTYYQVDEVPEGDRPIPIGRSCENTEVFALREDGLAAGIDEEGELYVRGSAVMKGYWGRPERSATALVQNPLNPHVPELVYRTGDLVRLRPDGNYEFLGRRDHQIKSRGYRIELGEVEVALHACPGVEDAVAVAVPHEAWGKAIVAFVVSVNGTELAEDFVKDHVARRLPRYMVPAAVEIVDSLPRTSNGKVDRQLVLQEAMSENVRGG